MLFAAANNIRSKRGKSRSRTSHKQHKKYTSIPATLTNNVSSNQFQSTPTTHPKIQYEGKNDDEYVEDSLKSTQTETKIKNESINCDTFSAALTSMATKQKTLSKQTRNETFIALISNTDTQQRQDLKLCYAQQFGFDIDRYINQNFKGIFKRILLYSFQTHRGRDLYLLSIACKKMKNINCVLPLLCICESNQRMKQILSTYQSGIFEKGLQTQIMKLCHDPMLRSFLRSILNGQRKRLPQRLLKDDCVFLSQILLDSSVCKWSETEQMRFLDIFSRRTFEYLQCLCGAFESLTHIPLLSAIKERLQSQSGIGYAIVCILLYVSDRNQFYRNLLMKGIVSGGHKHILFWRVIINRMDCDLMDILDSYGLYEGGKSDVDLYNVSHFIKVTLRNKDESAAQLLLNICNLL